MELDLHRLRDADLDPDTGANAPAGKSSLTSRLTPAPQIVFRVSDPETARALGEAMSGGRGRIQRAAERDDNGVAAGAEAAVERAAGSSGHALPTSVQRQFEQSTGADLSGVRVHTGGDSAAAAHAVGAKAYTVGQDIHFAEGRYQPDDPFGLHLLAHEVAHTVQQQGGAARRQHKLEVSTPHDAAEHEADRAADAMVRGQAAEIGGGSGLARQVVQRDKNPGDTPADPNAKADPNANNGAGDEKTAIDWWVDWQAKQTGSAVSSKSNARTGKDAATGTLKVIPEAGAGDPKTSKWVNASSSGAVHAGNSSQKKDTGGQVSSDIAYGKAPSASATVKVVETAEDKTHTGKSQLPAKQKAASAAAAAKLEADLPLQGEVAALQASMLAAAKAAVGDGGTGYSYEVSVDLKQQLDANGGNPKAAPAVAYTASARRTVSIVVPTELQKLKGNAAVETIEAEQHKKAEQKASHVDSSKKVEESKEEATEQSVVTDVETYTHQAWEEFKKKLTTKSLSAEGNISGNIGGSLGGSASLADLEIDFGTVLGALTLPELGPAVSLLISKAIGKGKIGGSYNASIGGELKGYLGGKTSWSDEDLKQTISKFDQQVKTKLSTSVKTSVKTKFASVKTQSKSKDEASQVDDANQKQKKVSASNETIGVKYVIGEPTLTVS